jgi:hypothetical protein
VESRLANDQDAVARFGVRVNPGGYDTCHPTALNATHRDLSDAVENP